MMVLHLMVNIMVVNLLLEASSNVQYDILNFVCIYSYCGSSGALVQELYPSGLKFLKGSWLCVRPWSFVTGAHLVFQAFEEYKLHG